MRIVGYLRARWAARFARAEERASQPLSPGRLARRLIEDVAIMALALLAIDEGGIGAVVGWPVFMLAAVGMIAVALVTFLQTITGDW